MLGVAQVPDSFTAKSESKTLTYRYFISSEDLDLLKMQEAAVAFKGKHNFRRFLNSQYDKIQINPIVEILDSKIVLLEHNSNFYPVAYYEVKSTNFFVNQVN